MPVALAFSLTANLHCKKHASTMSWAAEPRLHDHASPCPASAFIFSRGTSNRHTTDMLAFPFLPSVISAKARLSFHFKEKDHDQKKTAPHRMPLAPQLYEKMHRLWARPGSRCLYERRPFREQHIHVRCMQLRQGKIRRSWKLVADSAGIPRSLPSPQNERCHGICCHGIFRLFLKKKIQ